MNTLNSVSKKSGAKQPLLAFEWIPFVGGRFDDDDDCFGWSNETYLKGWRNPEFRLPKGRYLVKVTINSSGDKVYGFFKLENSVARQHFRLLPASETEAAKLRSQD
ncbi:MAG: hypothetical protein ABSG27_10420 [Candidatus Acidiferrales bacterium]|jgi:hypothetical protein